MRRVIRVRREIWPLRQPFRISRGSRSTAEVVVVEIESDGMLGRGECVPYRHYGETVDSVIARIERLAPALGEGLQREQLQQQLPPGAARNACDCALWDLEAKQAGRRAWNLAGIPQPPAVTCAYTLSLGSIEAMTAAAATHAHRPLLKLKLDADDVVNRVRAVRGAAPASRIIVDANEAWSAGLLERVSPELRELGVEMIEQPLPAGEDAALDIMEHPVAIGADESCHVCDDLDALSGRYDIVNIKLDKTGGLTQALKLHEQARVRKFRTMVGCMLGTSLAMAPALLLTPGAEFVDLDGPLWLAGDRTPGLRYADGRVAPPDSDLWG